MPDPRQFFKGFGLNVGRHYGEFKLLSASTQHQRLRPGEYIYHTTLVFISPSSPSFQSSNNLKQILTQLVAQPRVINTPRSSYMCDFGKMKFDGSTVTALGYCQRL